MADRFTQKRAFYRDDASTGRLQVSKLISLLDNHPYKSDVINAFDIENISDDFIIVDHIDLLFNKIASINKNFERFNAFVRISACKPFYKA